MILVFSILFAISGLVYLGLLLFCFFQWSAKKEERTSSITGAAVEFSIIVPARNEELILEASLNSLISQTYLSSAFEIIVVDDYSTDKTAEIVSRFALKHNRFQIRLVRMVESGNSTSSAFKKQAIAEGINQSRFDWIITTDADCFRGTNWLSSLNDFIQKNDPVMICGPVRLEHSGSLLQRMQVIEFAGLVGSAGAALEGGLPMTCNGANLAYNREAFYTVGGFAGINALNSGDDEMLMMKMHKQWPGRVRFLKNRDAIVHTPAQPTLRDFIQQRKRWVSKSGSHGMGHTVLLSLIYLYHALIILGFIGGFFSPFIFTLVVLALFAKAFVEWPFLYQVCTFFGRQKLALLYPLALLPQTFYVFFIGIYGNLGTYNWKGRTLR